MRSRSKRSRMIMLGIGALAGSASAAYIGRRLYQHYRSGKPKAGRIQCPSEVGRSAADASDVEPGDHVVVSLVSGDGSFSESTWVSVVEHYPTHIVGRISGEMTDAGIRALSTDKHGFRLGHTVEIPMDCVWEVFIQTSFSGHILCGPQVTGLAEYLKDPGLYPVAGGLTVERGDMAEVMIASDEAQGTAWHERLVTVVTSVSDAGSVITARVTGAPSKTSAHGLTVGDSIRFNRDCIVGT